MIPVELAGQGKKLTHLKVLSSKMDPLAHSQVVLLALGVEPVGHGLHTLVMLAVPREHTQAVPFHSWLTPHLLTQTLPSLIKPNTHWQVALTTS